MCLRNIDVSQICHFIYFALEIKKIIVLIVVKKIAGSNSLKLVKTVETVVIGLFVIDRHHNKLWCCFKRA